ncbi:MAG: hypothetical protein LC754_11940 [Acidobacteria bacterium]|nr:hypothetical protein [Acidobacteriota bacterium]
MPRYRQVALAAFLLACTGLSSVPVAFARQKAEAKPVTAEQVAETVILVFGQRERLSQIRRSGVERGQLVRTTDDGRAENISYERSFKRGETIEKDKIRLDQKKPTLEYSLILNDGHVWGLVKGTPFTPRQEDVADFLAESQHSLDILLRYKENGATLNLAGKDKQKGIEMWILEVTDKNKLRTRYYVSTKSGKVLALEYEDTAPGDTKPVKFRRTFHDYQVVQGTSVPKRTVLFENDRQVEDAQILSVVYGIKMDDALFKNPEAAAAQP